MLSVGGRSNARHFPRSPTASGSSGPSNDLFPYVNGVLRIYCSAALSPVSSIFLPEIRAAVRNNPCPRRVGRTLAHPARVSPSRSNSISSSRTPRDYPIWGRHFFAKFLEKTGLEGGVRGKEWNERVTEWETVGSIVSRRASLLPGR